MSFNLNELYQKEFSISEVKTGKYINQPIA